MSKTVFITGAAKRIGRHVSLSLARAGYDILIHHGHSDSEAASLAAEIVSLGQKSHILKADLGNPGSLESQLASIPPDFEIVALINNAAIFEPVTFLQTDLAAWNAHLAVNLTSPFLLSQWFVKKLPPDKTGRIINILDWRALRPGADHFPYTISKAALAAMTKSLAASVPDRMIVNGVALGAVLPPSDGSSPEKMLQSVPSGRTASLDEVAQLVLFLLQGPGYISGEIIHLDGGRHLV